MYHFFVTQDQIGPETITITGPDVNHMKNVLRMKPGEEILISNGVDKDYRCQVETLDSDAVTAESCQWTRREPNFRERSICSRDFPNRKRWN